MDGGEAVGGEIRGGGGRRGLETTGAPNLFCAEEEDVGQALRRVSEF
jgi:hypothetical protein